LTAHLSSGLGSAQGSGDPLHVVEDVPKPRGLEADHVHLASVGHAGHGAPHVVQGHGAHLAEVLGDDHVGRQLCKLLVVHPVDAERVNHHLPDRPVDVGAAPERLDPGPGQHRSVLDLFRKVALVGYADEIVSAPTAQTSRWRTGAATPLGECVRLPLQPWAGSSGPVAQARHRQTSFLASSGICSRISGSIFTSKHQQVLLPAAKPQPLFAPHRTHRLGSIPRA
jgi:hypothetical protein